MSVFVRHQTASGRLDECWSYHAKHERGPLVSVLARFGNVSMQFDVLVCCAERPRFGAHAITRADAESWRIVPARYVRIWSGGVESLAQFPCPIIRELGHRTLILTNTPHNVSKAIEEL